MYSLFFIGIVIAGLQDLKRREVDNLWNFSLIFFALAYRGFVSVFNGNYWFVLNGFIGLGIFFLLANLFYYSRLFAGGDAKLLMALGTILPLSYNWILNLKIFGLFVLLFFTLGAVYALIWSFFVVFANWSRFVKEFRKQWKNYKKMFLISLIFVLLWTGFVFAISQIEFVFIGLVVLLFPLLFVFVKSVEESCMVKLISPDKVTEGDWLYRDVRVRGKKIKSCWEGVSKFHLRAIRKSRKKILVKQGIPFTVAFLLGFVALLWLIWRGMIFCSV